MNCMILVWQTDRQTGRQAGRQADWQAGRKTDRDRQRDRQRQKYRDRDREIDRQTDRDRERNRQRLRQRERRWMETERRLRLVKRMPISALMVAHSGVANLRPHLRQWQAARRELIHPPSACHVAVANAGPQHKVIDCFDKQEKHDAGSETQPKDRIIVFVNTGFCIIKASAPPCSFCSYNCRGLEIKQSCVLTLTARWRWDSQVSPKGQFVQLFFSFFLFSFFARVENHAPTHEEESIVACSVEMILNYHARKRFA